MSPTYSQLIVIQWEKFFKKMTDSLMGTPTDAAFIQFFLGTIFKCKRDCKLLTPLSNKTDLIETSEYISGG